MYLIVEHNPYQLYVIDSNIIISQTKSIHFMYNIWIAGDLASLCLQGGTKMKKVMIVRKFAEKRRYDALC